MSEKFAKIRILLEEQHTFPCEYTFKFIVPVDKVAMILASLGEEGVSTKASKKGNFISVTCTRTFEEVDQVITVYESVQHIEGCISL